MKPTTVHIILTLVVQHQWSIYQLDVNNDFLQGFLTNDVYIQQPQGFVNKYHPLHVCKLHNALYGLHQAPRIWFTEFKGFLVSIGFINSHRTSLFLFIITVPLHYFYLFMLMTFLSQATLTL